MNIEPGNRISAIVVSIMNLTQAIWFLLLFLLLPGAAPAQQTTEDSPIHIDADRNLTYNSQENGDRVPDFSYAGYMLSEKPIPDVPVKVIVPAMAGDATGTIQKAINYVASLPVNENGFRGAILLEKGTFELRGSLYIRVSGVVLRGSGSGSDGTILYATGGARETVLQIAGKNNLKEMATVKVAETYIPVNATVLPVGPKHPFKVGDQVIVNRPSTKEWLEILGADEIGIHVDYPLTHWEPGDFDINWYREVVAVSPASVTIDVPLTNSLDPQYGGGEVSKYKWEGRINKVGVENIRFVSSYDETNAKDENHRWMAVTLENVRDSWVRRIVAEHFVSSAVAVWETASRITVEDSKSLAPVGEIGNHRRFAFHTLGQQVLFQRCYAEYAYHAFSVGFTAPGPNVFSQCYSYMPLYFSGAIGGWATGVLFDKITVDGGNVSLAYRDVDGQGGGWTAANSLLWQPRAAKVHLSSPPTAQNWAYGIWAQGYGNGHYELSSEFIKPESLFYAQLKARTGKASPEEEKILTYETTRTSAPSPELAAELSEGAKSPDITMNTWIDQMITRYPIYMDLNEAKNISEIAGEKEPEPTKPAPPVSIQNGRVLKGEEVLTGRRNRTSLWRGSTRPGDIAEASPNLVRFVPGRTGRGLTDDLDTLVADMIRKNVVAMQSFPALWYERRRDDHSRTRRTDADVWTPFYEQPFSRSGQGEAFDRLSKYDLTKWNSWYWLRLKNFADRADQNGLVFIQEHYLQHNIIEEGAHWADYPWRTANNINNTGFAEDPAYAGDKRIYMAEEFYDTTHTVRRKLHRNYIRKSLDNFKGNNNVIHHLGWEYTGPLHFVEFWLDVIGEWEAENGENVMVMLPGTKDVQDAILTDPKRSRLVEIIDVIQWQYREDGTLYAPEGGQSLAQRQYVRIMEVGETSFSQIYRAVQEFRKQYPEKAIVYSRRGTDFSNWAVFMGGGSLASLPTIEDENFLRQAAEMAVVPVDEQNPKRYLLRKKGTGYIVFSEIPDIEIDLTEDKVDYLLKWIDPSTGEIMNTESKISGGEKYSLKAPLQKEVVLWLTKRTKK